MDTNGHEFPFNNLPFFSVLIIRVDSCPFVVSTLKNSQRKGASIIYSFKT
jgi:hypothetical protein